MISHMRHMGNSGKIAIGAFLAALALLVLTGVTLHEAVLLWFLAASATAYVACVAEVVIRRRHKTLLASGVGSILFIAFGIAFLRQWGLAFNADPGRPVHSASIPRIPDLYFYLAAAAGAATLLLLFAGTVLPGRGPAPRAGYASRRPAAASRRPVPRKPPPGLLPGRQRPGPAPARASATELPHRAFGNRASAKRAAAARTPVSRTRRRGRRYPRPSGLVVVGCRASAKAPVKPAVKPAVKVPARPSAKAPTRR